MNKKTIAIFVALLGLVLACSLGNPVNTGPSQNQAEISPDPVAIYEGLASLNSYNQVVEYKSTGPTLADFNIFRIETQQDRTLDLKLVHYTITQSSSDGSEPSVTESYNYSIGTAKCAGNEADGWEYTLTNPQEQEMSDLLRTMTDMMPLIDNPVFVGSETFNGIAANHFTFQVGGLGLESGAEVKANQGDYWLAQDGQYIVKYQLIIETLDPTNQTTMRMEVLLDLTNINQPVNIVIPAGCVP